ncbi:hypothetical protein ACQKO6_19890 [Pseudomonas monteilii]|jgi:hypothetical protein|uniref:hypothetical protein n=1 Tax=Pseudomonas alabamensis TaxID=3064349 RepID=UPI0021D84D98|nr:hypothetical protein [Pseudomonas entomophila]
MSGARAFINPRPQSYASLKADLRLTAYEQTKFDVLNAHIVDRVVRGGELVIVGDPDTPSCTRQEAYLMGKAAIVHQDIELSGAGVDDFFIENFELLQSLLTHASLGVGAVGAGWSGHLEHIKKTLEDIERLHRTYLGGGTLKERDVFYAMRAELFAELDRQLKFFLAHGAGLRRQASIKRMLEISTKSYLTQGEIARYAEKTSGVAKAVNVIRRGVYVGIGLEVTAAGLKIQQACTVGRDEACREAKYVESASLTGSIAGGLAGGAAGGAAASYACVFLGLATRGLGKLACAVIGGSLGGEYIGQVGSEGGALVGRELYEANR